jgi:hypothetical protein
VTWFRRALLYAPAAGVVLFIVLYAIAALLYPGGSYDDRHAPGFSLVHNYFCDLLHPVALNGVVNPGRGIGLVAMALIVPTLVFFWHSVVVLFANQRALRLTTRIAGSISAAGMLLLLTPFHDSAVEIGGGFGLVAFFAVLAALPRAKHGLLFLGGVAAMVVSAACFFIWRTGVGLPALASLQKLAFALFLAWVLVASLAAGHASRTTVEERPLAT